MTSSDFWSEDTVIVSCPEPVLNIAGTSLKPLRYSFFGSEGREFSNQPVWLPRFQFEVWLTASALQNNSY